MRLIASLRSSVSRKRPCPGRMEFFSEVPVPPHRTGSAVPKVPDFKRPHVPGGHGPALAADICWIEKRVCHRLLQDARSAWRRRHEPGLVLEHGRMGTHCGRPQEHHVRGNWLGQRRGPERSLCDLSKGATAVPCVRAQWAGGEWTSKLDSWCRVLAATRYRPYRSARHNLSPTP